MTFYDIHLELDATEDFSLMPVPLQEQLQALSSEWPSFPALGTKENLGRKLVHARVQHNNLTEAVLLNLFSSFNLNWTVHGIREAYTHNVIIGTNTDGSDIIYKRYRVVKLINKATVLPFIVDVAVADPITNIVATTPVKITDIIYLPMYAGTDPIVL